MLSERGDHSVGVRYCGRALAGPVGFGTDGEQVWPIGVRRCSLLWVCAVCSARIRAYRAREVEHAAAGHVAQGGRLAMVTLTVRHSVRMSLEDIEGALGRSYRLLTQRQGWSRVRRHLVGSIRALEVTHGSNGWHPHLHLLLFVEPGVREAELRHLVAEVEADWLELTARYAGRGASRERGLDLRWLGDDALAARYVSKVSKEVTMADTKSGRDPFALLDGGDARSAGLWHEYARHMKGHQSVAWSKGLRERLGIVDVEDEQIDDAPVVVRLPVFVQADEWNSALDEGRAADLLHELEVALPSLLELAFSDTG